MNVQARRYLNNIVEQDHRAIKRHCAPMLGLKSFATAVVTLSQAARRLLASGIDPTDRRKALRQISVELL